MHVRCMSNARISTHEKKCVKHTYRDQNMINMHNPDSLQKLVLIGVQKNEKNTIYAFYQTLRVHILHIYVK